MIQDMVIVMRGVLGVWFPSFSCFCFLPPPPAPLSPYLGGRGGREIGRGRGRGGREGGAGDYNNCCIYFFSTTIFCCYLTSCTI